MHKLPEYPLFLQKKVMPKKHEKAEKKQPIRGQLDAVVGRLLLPFKPRLLCLQKLNMIFSGGKFFFSKFQQFFNFIKCKLSFRFFFFNIILFAAIFLVLIFIPSHIEQVKVAFFDVVSKSYDGIFMLNSGGFNDPYSRSFNIFVGRHFEQSNFFSERSSELSSSFVKFLIPEEILAQSMSEVNSTKSRSRTNNKINNGIRHDIVLAQIIGAIIGYFLGIVLLMIIDKKMRSYILNKFHK